VLSLIGAIVAYPVALYVITKHRQRAARHAEPLPPPKPLR
jgi:hypothetical protein